MPPRVPICAGTRTMFPADAHERLVAEVAAVLDDPRFAPLFSAGSRAEVAIVGRVERAGRAPLLVSGQIDRLAVTGDAVLIADFKTNRSPPRTLEAAPPAYVEQLALYGAVLARLYPGRPLRAALIWTEAPDIMEISSDAPGPRTGSAHHAVRRLDAPCRRPYFQISE